MKTALATVESDPLAFYNSLPAISKEFINEVAFRVKSAERAMELLSKYKSPRYKFYSDAKSIRFITARFAMMEIATLLDGTGKLSLKLQRSHKGRYSVQRDKLAKLLPFLNGSELLEIERRLTPLITKHSTLIDRLLHTRHTRLAHAGVSRGILDDKSLTSLRFPMARLFDLAAGLWRIFLPLMWGDFQGHSSR